jgi:hypothetical protein
MNEQPKSGATDNKAPRRAPPNGRAVSDPRDVATLVLARMNVVNARKDELTIAIKGLSDITQQLANAYSEQSQRIEHLKRRLFILEAAAGKRDETADGDVALDQAEPGPHLN